MSYDGDMKKIIRRAQELDFRYRFTDNGHHQFYAPNGHDVIYAGGTPGSSAAFNAFMSHMRRAGYRDEGEATTSLAEELAKVGFTNGDAPPAVPPAPPGTRLTARQILRDHFASHPGITFNIEQAAQVVAALRPDLGPTAASQALASMALRGELMREGVGEYRLPSADDRKPRAYDPPPTPASASVPPQPPATEEELDAEDIELDAALTKLLDGFTTIERIIKKNRENRRAIARQRASLKKMLEEL